MIRTPFHEAEVALGATFGDFSGWSLPRHFGPFLDEVTHARRQGGIVDASSRSKLKLSGPDAVAFLQNYTTADLKALGEGEGLQTALTTWKGTMIDHAFVYRLEDGLRVIGHVGTAPVIRRALEKFMFGVDLEIEDLTEARGMLHVFGPNAARVLEEAAAGEAVADLPMHAFRLVGLGGADALVARTWPLAGLGFMVLVPSEQASQALEAVSAAARAADVPFIGQEAYEILRVEAGIPSFPGEINEDRNPWEVRLSDSVSMRKGCYLGQEVVARLANYQKVQRYLVGLDLSGPVEAGAALLDPEGKAVGMVTSVALAPDAERPVALGFLRPEWAEEGRTVRVAVGEAVGEAVVRDRAFWRELRGAGVAPQHA